MAKNQEIEALLTTIINLFADAFGKQAILRGGMVLRLLDSPRLTNDLDYVFVPFKSKNDITKAVIDTLNSLEDVTVTHSLNSKCLRCIVKKGEITAQVEIKVDRDCRVNVLSTAVISKLHNQTPRIINVMAYDIAMANKLAAWFERRLVRDLFDIYLFISMGIAPDRSTLTKRLHKPTFSKRVVKGKRVMTLDVFFDFLKQEVEGLSEQDIVDELGALMPKTELLGLTMKIKKAIITKL